MLVCMMESIKKLRDICQSKPKELEKDLGWRVKLLRFISIYFTKIFIKLGFSANQVTILWVVVGMISSIFFLNGSYLYNIVGALLLQLAFQWDYSDGEVARYRKESSLSGLYLDLIGHFLVNPLVVIFISIALTVKYPNFIFLGISASFSMFLIRMLTTEKYEVIKKELVSSTIIDIRNVFESNNKKSILDKVNFVDVILIFSILNLLNLFVIIAGIVFPIMFVRKLIKEFKYGFG